MTKTTELIYSTQHSRFMSGRAYSNPRFFTTVRRDVGKVFVVGDWPKVVSAYEAAGIPVVHVAEMVDLMTFDGAAPAAKTALEPGEAQGVALVAPALSVDEMTDVDIPDNWRDLSWTRSNDDGLTLRGLAAKFSAAPVLNKAVAVAAITAELARRGATARERPDAQDIAVTMHHQGHTAEEIEAELAGLDRKAAE